MTSAPISIGLLYIGSGGGESRIIISGEPDEDAVVPLEQAVFSVTGRDVSDYGRADGESVFVLSSTREEDRDPLGADYLHLPARITFRELRLVVGPRDFETRAQLTGFGGDGLFDGFVAWEIADAINFGRDALELYGAVEIARRLGRAMRRRARRDRRRIADVWAHEGGPVPEDLVEAVERQHSWSDGEIKTYFELDRAEARLLMAACGYTWSSEDARYFRPGDLDAVN